MKAPRHLKDRARFIKLQHDINAFGMDINQATATKNTRKINRLKKDGVALLSQIDNETLPVVKAHLHYNLGNLWSFRTVKEGWDWENPARANEIIHFRKAAKFSKKNPKNWDGEKAQIYVNLANAFNERGRFIIAQHYWDKALEVNPKFGMAWAGKGYGLHSYAQAMYDPHQRIHFLIRARDCFDKAFKCKEKPIEPHAIDFFKEIHSKIIDYLKNKNHNFKKFKNVPDQREAEYIEWCLNQRLYLNPLNEITAKNVAAHDIISFPTVAVPVRHGPYFLSMFDHLKQEFSAARTMLYEGLHVDKKEYLYTEKEDRHYSDRNLKLNNTWDGMQLSFGTEKSKIAFRCFYSLLDKVSWLLNAYMKIETNEKHRVDIKSVWYKDLRKLNGISPKFKRRKNWPLRGLFWLSKDIFEPELNRKTKLQNENYLYPEAPELDELRNWLEHKSVKIVSGKNRRPYKGKKWHGADTLVITQEDFNEKTLWLAKLCREAIINLSLAVHREEKMRAKKNAPGKEKLTLSQGLPTL